MVVSDQAIRVQTVDTGRLRIQVKQTGELQARPVIFIHGNFSSSVYFERLMQELPGSYRYIAIDLRGYGLTEDIPVDATRGARDWSEDLQALFDSLDIEAAHILGWSLGAGVAMQFLLDRPKSVRSLTLVAPVSPFGFGGTRDNNGTPCYRDYAGCGGGLVNPEFIRRLEIKDRQSDSEFSPLNTLRNSLVNPPFSIPDEDRLLTASLQQKLGDQRYPGDSQESPNWPFTRPGKWGPLNALSGQYFDVSGIVDLTQKPPILWLRGDKDTIISDHSLTDVATLGEMQIVPDWPGMEAFPPQPMVSQMRSVLEQYQGNGGSYQEVVFENCGHSPFLEDTMKFKNSFMHFLNSA